MDLIIFEDKNADGFYPLSVSHPVFDLFYGCYNIVERYRRFFKPDNIFLSCRDYLSDVARERYEIPVNDFNTLKDECLLINAALMPDIRLYQQLLSAKPDTAFICNEALIAAKLSSDKLKNLLIKDSLQFEAVNFLNTSNIIEMKNSVFKHLWDIVNFNGQAIAFDLKHVPGITDWQSSPISNKYGDNVYIHETAEVPDGVFVDASAGPVIIDENAVIEPRTLIQGPVYIGKNSHALAGMIREGTSLGPTCKAGGELEETIIMGYSNKAHEGFIGHAYIGEWVNLGALTTNSDLKNNYSEIKVQLNNKLIPTGSIKVGCFFGDHTKTGIGTLLNTGIAIGFCSNIYGGALFTDKEINHFRWGTPGNLIDFKLEKAIEIAKIAMARRDVEFTSAYEKLFKHIADTV